MAHPAATDPKTQAHPAEAPPTPDRLMALANGFWASSILSAAASHQFFRAIANGARTAQDVARASGTSPTGTRMVLDALTALNVLTKHNGEYGFAADTRAFLVDGQPLNLAPFVADHTPLLWEAWGHLREALARPDGQRQLSTAEAGAEFFPKLIRAILPMSLGPADAVAQHLGIGTKRSKVRVLDVGAGGCAWSMPIARRDPSARVTAFDLEAVLPETKAIVAEHGLSGQYDFVAGDLNTADFGEGKYDVALLGHICHGETPDQNQSLFARLHRALAPGGHLVIGDFIPDEDRTGPPLPVLFAVNMFLMGGADTYTLAEYRRWLGQAGFSSVTPFDTKRMPSPVIIAARNAG